MIVDEHDLQHVRHDSSNVCASRRPGRAGPIGTTTTAASRTRARCRDAERLRACRPVREFPAARTGQRAVRQAMSDAAAVVLDRELDRVGSEPNVMVMRLAPECLMAFVSASRPMRRRWCSSDASSLGRPCPPRVRRPAPTCSASSDAPCGERAREVAALERLRSRIHDRAPRLFEAVAQHVARDVERPTGGSGRRPSVPATASSCRRFRRGLVRTCRELASRPACARSRIVWYSWRRASQLVHDPERRAAGNERQEHGDHDGRMSEGPPRRRLQQDDIAG